MESREHLLREFEKKLDQRIARYEPAPVVYANFWSKLFFAHAFRNQFAVPLPQPAWVDWLMERIESASIPAGLDAIPIRAPIFVVGLPRSGTTLLHYLLAAHDDATGFTNIMNSFPNALLAIDRIQRALRLNIRGDRHLRDSVEVNFTSPSEPIMPWQAWTGQDMYDLTFRRLARRDLGEAAVARIHRDVRKVLHASRLENPRFVCKYPYFATQMPVLREIFPDARFIHIVRDPKRVCPSMAKLYLLIEHQRLLVRHPSVKTIVPYPRVPSLKALIDRHGPESPTTTATVWKETADLIENDGAAMEGNLFQIRYEDLLDRPAETMAGVFEFARLRAPAPENARYAAEFAKIGKLRHENRYVALPEIERIAGSTARRYGY